MKTGKQYHIQSHTGLVPEDPITISSQVISNDLTMFVGRVKIHNDLRERIEIVGVAYEGMGEIDPINIQTHITEVFSQITPEQMAEYQRVDNQIGPIIPWVQEGKVPPKSVLYKVKSKTCRKLYFQFDRFVLKKGVLHRLYIHEDMEYHQLVLPQRLHNKVLGLVHDNMGHQGVERTLELLRERVYWPTMAADATKWVSQCTRCQVAQGTYNEPKPKIGHLESNNPMDLLCLDFTKIDPSRTGKENVLVMTDAFSKFSITGYYSKPKSSNSG